MKTPALSRLSTWRTPRISSPFHSGTPSTLRICAPMSDSVCATSRGASAARTAARSLTTLRKTLRVIGMGCVAGALLPAHARHDGHVAADAAARASSSSSRSTTVTCVAPRHEREGARRRSR